MATTMHPKPFPDWTIGDRLRKAREVAGYRSASSFADDLGISRDTLRKYEDGRGTPRPIVLREWARLTGFTVDQLLGSDSFTPPDGGNVTTLCISPAPLHTPGDRHLVAA